MAVLGEILVQIKATAGQFVSELKTASDATGTFINALDKHKDAIKDISRSFAVASAAMAGALAYSVNEAAGAEKINARLVQSLKNIGISSTGAADALQNTAESVGSLASFCEDDLKFAMASVINMTGDYNVALKHTSTIADLARAAQVDLQTAARLVGMAYNGNTSALNRYGISIAKGMSGMQALDAIQRRFYGSGASYTKTFNGQMETLKNLVGDIAKRIGATLLPSLNSFLQKVNGIALSIANMSTEQATTIAKFLAFGTAITGAIAVLGTFSTSLVSINAAFALARTGATALFTTLMAHPFVAMAVAIASVVTALGYLGNKVVEDQNKHAQYKASTQGQIDKFTALKDIATRAGNELVWFAGRQITGIEAAKKYDIILDMLNGKLTTNTKKTKENGDAKIVAAKKTDTLTESLKKAAIEMANNENTTKAYSGAVVSGFDAMTAAVVENNRLTGEELKIGLKAMLDAILSYYMQQLAAQMAVYVSMLFNPITAANAAGGIAATAAQMAVVSGLKIGVALLENGGIVDRPTLSWIGEGSSPEAVIPLPKLAPMIQEAMNTTNNNGDISITINAGGDMRDVNWDALVKTQIKPALDRNLRMAGANS